jgi:hypothetical protein
MAKNGENHGKKLAKTGFFTLFSAFFEKIAKKRADFSSALSIMG